MIYFLNAFNDDCDCEREEKEKQDQCVLSHVALDHV